MKNAAQENTPASLESREFKFYGSETVFNYETVITKNKPYHGENFVKFIDSLKVGQEKLFGQSRITRIK